MVSNAIDKCTELSCVAKHAFTDDLEDARELWVELEAGVPVCVTQIFHVFRQVTEEEDVVFADFACDLDVGAVAGAFE